MTEWQPIETAPSDGTWVLVAPGDTEPVSIGKFTGERGICFSGGKAIKLSGWVDLQSYCGMDHGDCSQDYASIWPTHWMPVPDPPKETTK